jgi:PLP dependent protein
MTGPDETSAGSPGRSDQLAAALAAVEERLAGACAAAGRARSELTLVAVSKTRPVSDVTALAALGVTDFGESTDQEARGKAAALRAGSAAGGPRLRWHFVGRLQRNKAASVAAYADVVHSVDRPALATALARGASRAGRRVTVLLQVSLDGDPRRGGVLPDALAALAEHVVAAEELRLAGVMAVAPQGHDPAPAFARLRRCSLELQREHPEAVEISAGMSADLEQAVAHGATQVRIGGALFGPRPPVNR